MKTLKREEIYANEYEDLDHLRTNIGVHRAVLQSSAVPLGAGLPPPEEFERQIQCQTETADAKAATITFVAGLAQSSTGMLEQGTQTEGVTKPAAM